MPWGIAAAAVAAAGSAYAGSQARKAANEQADAAAAANDIQLQMFEQSRQDLYPYRQSGYNALNAYNRAMGLPTVGQDDPSAAEPLFGGGDRPMTEAELREAYQLVLGRDADPSGLNYYMTGGPKVGGEPGGIQHLNPVLGAASRHIGERSGLLGALGFGGDDGTRRSYTFNEFLNATLTSDEYRQKVADGTIEAWDPARLQPQQEVQAAPEDRYGGFYASPGYQFRMDEGIQALDRSAAARGRLLSGAQNKAINRYAQGTAANEFHDYTQRLAQIAGLGAQFEGQNANLMMAQGQAGANAARSIGDARASSYLSQGNTAGNIGNIFSDVLMRYGGRRNNLAGASNDLDSLMRNNPDLF